MDVPGYAGGGVGELNSSPNSTIAVLDSGMDVTNPDLADVFYTFSAEQQEKYGCGEHGLNVTAEPGSDAVGDISDHLDHGTHVSGIMAAAWDGHGTAGIANGAKIVGVRLSDATMDGIVVYSENPVTNPQPLQLLTAKSSLRARRAVRPEPR